MALTLTINGAAVSNVRWDLSSWSAAGDLGAASYAEIVIDDPSGTLSVTEWKQVTIEESACSQPRLFTGYVHEVEIERADPYAGAARRWTIRAVDANALLYMRLVSGSDGDRPAETWSARKSWLLASDYLQGAVSDTGKIASGLDTVNLAATDYRDQSPDAVISDLVALTGLNNAPLNYFVFWDPSPATGSARLGLFLNSEDDTSWVSSLKLSNVPAEIDLTTVWPAEASLTRRGDRIYSGVVITWPTGRRYVTRSATATTYIARDYATYRPNIGRVTTAIEAANNRLESRKSPEEVVTATVELPATHAGLILPGQGLDVRFSHLPGLTTTTRLRVVRVGWQLIGPDRYLLTLELSKPRITAAGGSRPQLPLSGSAPELVQHVTHTGTASGPTLSKAPTPGNLLVWCYSDGWGGCNVNAILGGNGWTQLGSTFMAGVDGRDRYLAIFAKIATSSDGAQLPQPNNGCQHDSNVSEWAGISSLSQVAASAGNQAGQSRSESVATPVRPSAALVIAAAFSAKRVTPVNFTFSAGFTELADVEAFWFGHFAAAYLVDATADPSYTCTATSNSTGIRTGLVLAVLCEPAPAPRVGDQAPPAPPKEAPDGTRTTFTTEYPYAPGSFRVLVDRIDATDQVTGGDPATGTFTLSFAPEADEQIEVYYIRGQ